MSAERVGLVVMVYTCIRDVLSSNLDWDTSYSDRGLTRFLQSLQPSTGEISDQATTVSFLSL
jgi:hypothetical protein